MKKYFIQLSSVWHHCCGRGEALHPLSCFTTRSNFLARPLLGLPLPHRASSVFGSFQPFVTQQEENCLVHAKHDNRRC